LSNEKRERNMKLRNASDLFGLKIYNTSHRNYEFQAYKSEALEDRK